MGQDLIILLDGLRQGKNEFSWRVGGEFFSSFGTEDVRDADISVKAEVQKHGGSLSLEVELCGSITVPCDRCLGDLELPVDYTESFEVRFGSETSVEQGGKEVIFISAGESEWDLSQLVYDFSILSVPMHHVHEDGGCDPQALRYLSIGEAPSEEPTNDSPFAALKGLMK